MGIGLYIHIPFCLKKCNYCDFTSYPLKTDQVGIFLVALQQEMELYHHKLAEENLKLETIYLGGGTPSCLSGDQLAFIFEKIKTFFRWTAAIEVTIEVNPGTIDFKKLTLLKDLGVNRLSIGAQSFNFSELKRMGRLHDVGSILQTVVNARQAGFNNLSLDLIYGLPGQSLEQWQYSLQQALSLEPEHLSAYGLIIEKNTPWGDLAEKGELQPADQDLARLMFDEVQLWAQQTGYDHYEISNFAKPGFESKHNSRYWLLEPYLGLGVAASSNLLGQRWTNVTDLNSYRRLLNLGILPAEEVEERSEKDEISEALFLGLRLLRGVSLIDFEKKFGMAITKVFSEELVKLQDLGLIMIKGNHLQLTAKGIPVANEVFKFFV
ncbi:MAG: radical SAM family heme chaperone HemW [Bacillota bacterium]